MAADSTQKGEPKKQHETPSEKRANKRKKILQERRAKKLKRSQPKKRKVCHIYLHKMTKCKEIFKYILYGFP